MGSSGILALGLPSHGHAYYTGVPLVAPHDAWRGLRTHAGRTSLLHGNHAPIVTDTSQDVSSVRCGSEIVPAGEVSGLCGFDGYWAMLRVCSRRLLSSGRTSVWPTSATRSARCRAAVESIPSCGTRTRRPWDLNQRAALSTGPPVVSKAAAAVDEEKKKERDRNARILKALATHLWPDKALHPDANSLKAR